MAQSIELKMLGRIRGKGRAWVFSQHDFTGMGSRAAIDLALHRLLLKGAIRRVIRGLYDYPRFSTLLNQELSPDMDQVAQALVFDHTALKEAGFKRPESGLIVQALKSFGEERVTPEISAKIRLWLDPTLREKILADTKTATGWVYAAVQQICREGSPRPSHG